MAVVEPGVRDVALERDRRRIGQRLDRLVLRDEIVELVDTFFVEDGCDITVSLSTRDKGSWEAFGAPSCGRERRERMSPGVNVTLYLDDEVTL